MEIKTTLDLARECNDGNEGRRWVAVDDMKKEIRELRDTLNQIINDLDAVSD